MIKTCEIELFGRKLLLSERKSFDVIKSDRFINDIILIGKENNLSPFIFLSSVCVSDSLKINIEKLKFYNIIKWIIYKRITGKNYLLKNIPRKELFNLYEKILNLESDSEEVKKKAMTQSQ